MSPRTKQPFISVEQQGESSPENILPHHKLFWRNGVDILAQPTNLQDKLLFRGLGSWPGHLGVLVIWKSYSKTKLIPWVGFSPWYMLWSFDYKNLHVSQALNVQDSEAPLREKEWLLQHRSIIYCVGSFWEVGLLSSLTSDKICRWPGGAGGENAGVLPCRCSR